MEDLWLRHGARLRGRLLADLRVGTLVLQGSSGAQVDHTAQANFVISRIHSDSSNAFRARKLIPKVLLLNRFPELIDVQPGNPRTDNRNVRH